MSETGLARILALMPVRRGSVRIPNKNLQLMAGQPLVVRKVKQLQQSRHVTQVVVGTNCPEARSLALAAGASVVDRDEAACDEAVSPANIMIGDFVKRVNADIIVWSHCTNPFLYARHYDAAIDAFLEAETEGADSLLSVIRMQSHMWNEHGFPINYNPYGPKHALAKTLAPVFFQDGGIFIQRHANMLLNSYFFGRQPKLFEVEFPYSHDINVRSDLEIGRALAPMLDQVEGFTAGYV
ncbi:cytidylyltransferase domain-containing protein [Falsiroseomonas sp. HC035]|uniref:acylneuraminate cytidylyltransferase family protein n=1 Tax=Falsiroseomonas sp. HC035 TaxID=3390999 RepID=UPI003D316E78